MKIHEYQAKELLKAHGVPVQQGRVAFSLNQVPEIVAALPGPEWVLKAQVHAGGRGKAGGIKLVRSESEAVDAARKMFGMRLVTPQTGAEGKIVRRILFTEAAKIKKELYAGLIADRGKNRLVFMISREGGVEIEKVAEEHPEKIITEPIDPGVGLQAFQCRRMAFALGLAHGLAKEGAALFRAMYDAFCANDCSLVEINPLIIDAEDHLLALDVKVNLDDNALYRHPDLAALRDLDEEDPLEVQASKYNLNYIRLDGNVGCMVNGAGLAMATMDLIKLAGAEPANFLDVGGGASVETVANGFRIILSDPKVQAILINIFGGIVRCDRVAKGVIEAAQSLNVQVPIVVRLAGTNAAEAGALLQESGLKFHVAEDLAGAAQCVVQVMAH
ncbi:MAG TPA: ADP-forming succinate--CoA ligase subunit beta [bacterium]|nr:ADP-forming succinate--CoA ligase subunit beta [bacterium]HPN34370.1 ADP-forming succinate--CoA ligase subunit beta [bacterium]